MNTENVMPMPSQFPIYEDRRGALNRWYRGLYQCPVSEIIDMVIGPLRKGEAIKIKKLGIPSLGS